MTASLVDEARRDAVWAHRQWAAEKAAHEQTQASHARLVKALEPFATAYEKTISFHVYGQDGDKDPEFQAFLDRNTLLPAGLVEGDLRNAREALAEAKTLTGD